MILVETPHRRGVVGELLLSVNARASCVSSVAYADEWREMVRGLNEFL